MSTISETHHPVDAAVDRTTARTQVAIVIPTCNAARDWTRLSTGLRLQGLPVSQVLIIDSNSTELAHFRPGDSGRLPRHPHRDRSNFNHGWHAPTRGRTRSLWPTSSSTSPRTPSSPPHGLGSDRLLAAFEDKTVAAAYGRQLPRLAASHIEAHARLFNYPATGHVRDLESRHTLGIKAAFLSNSFAAYRVAPLVEVGGFPSNTIIGGRRARGRKAASRRLEDRIRGRSPGLPLPPLFHRRRVPPLLRHRRLPPPRVMVD